MTTIKIKFRRSTVPDKAGVLFFRLIHAREVKQITTSLKLFPAEWDERLQRVIVDNRNVERVGKLIEIQKELDHELIEWGKIIAGFQKRSFYQLSDVLNAYSDSNHQTRFDLFMQKCISELTDQGRSRTAETYRSTLSAFIRFLGHRRPCLEEIDRQLIDQFEHHLQARGITRNSSSFYMRILRSTYRKAVDQELCTDRNPFRNVYTGIAQTEKRAVDETVITRLESYVPDNRRLEFARDMFLFSFYARGMAFVDLFYLHQSNIVGNQIHYTRSKTKQTLSIRIEPCMEKIIERYPRAADGRLFPFAVSTSRNGKHTSALWLQNQRLKLISEQLDLHPSLSTYVSRHSWASIAKRKGVSISIISECMGHNNETTTRIYLASFEQYVIDETNQLVIGNSNNFRRKEQNSSSTYSKENRVR